MKSVIQHYEPDVQIPTYPSNFLEVSNQDQFTLGLDPFGLTPLAVRPGARVPVLPG